MYKFRKTGVFLFAAVLFLSFVTIPSTQSYSLRKRAGVIIDQEKVEGHYRRFKNALEILIDPKNGNSEHFKEELLRAANFYFRQSESDRQEIILTMQKLAEEYPIYTIDWVRRAMEIADYDQKDEVKQMLAAAKKPVDFEKTYAVIVAGGLASRMYPHNKLLNQFGDNEGNLLEETIWRMAQMLSAENIYIATTEELRSQIVEIAKQYGIPEKNIITDEPAGGIDTAAVFSYMSLKIDLDYPDQKDKVVMITPADSYVPRSDIDKYKADFTKAAEIVLNGPVVATIGIDPKGEPSIEFGHLLPTQETFFNGVSQVLFDEKPETPKKSLEILNKGGLYNAGIYVWQTDTIYSLMKYFAPDYFEGLQKIKESNGDPEVIREAMGQWNGWKTGKHPQRGSNISIDFVLSEPLSELQANPTKKREASPFAKGDKRGILFPPATIVGVPGTFSWDDIGNFKKVHKMETKRGNKDERGNAFKGEAGTAVFENTLGSFVWTEGSGKTIVLKGVEGLAVVDDLVHKTTVIAPLNNPKAVKDLRGKVVNGEYFRFLQEGLEEGQYMSDYYGSHNEGFDYYGKGFAVAENVEGIYVAGDKNLIAVTSVKDLIIIQFGNTLYVYGKEYKEEAEQIAAIVQSILMEELKDAADWRKFVDEDLEFPKLVLLKMAGRGDTLGMMALKNEIDIFKKGGIFPLKPYQQEKPWGSFANGNSKPIGEYWFSSVEKDKGSNVQIGDTDLPLAAVVDKEPVLLKYLTPSARERIGDLSLQVHDTKNKIWIVTTKGTVALGFSPEKIAEFKDKYGDEWEQEFKEEFKDLLIRYNDAVRELAELLEERVGQGKVWLSKEKDILLAGEKIIHHDKSDGVALSEKTLQQEGVTPTINYLKKIKLNPRLVLSGMNVDIRNSLKSIENSEKTYSSVSALIGLEFQLDSFWNIIEVKPGDIVNVPAGMPHALLHGTEVIEPQVAGRTLRFADGTRYPLRTLDVDEAVEVMKVVSGEAATEFPKSEDGAEIIGEFDGLRVERITLNRTEQYTPDTNNAQGKYHILSVIKGNVEIFTGEKGGSIVVDSPKHPVWVQNTGYTINPTNGEEAVVIRSYAPVDTESVKKSKADTLPEWWSADLPVPEFLDGFPEFTKYGTSGMRAHNDVLTDLEVYILTKGYINYLLKKDVVKNGDEFPIAGDLRISTDRIMQAKARAVRDIGLVSVHGGKVPTPALAYYAMYFDDMLAKACSMTTGSHIGWDKNGIKQYKPDGEVLKHEEPEILAHIMAVRREEYVKSGDETAFDSKGMFKEKIDVLGESKEQKVEDFFFERNMVFKHSSSYKQGKTGDKTIVVWKQTSVGGALLVKMAREFGFKVVEAAEEDEERFLGEREGGFRQIDTETTTEVHEEFFAYLAKRYSAFAVISADGDADRPIVADETGRFIMGDLVDLISAKVLGADFISMPVSCNSGTKRYAEEYGIEMEMTRIGSVYPIKAGLEAVKRGKKAIVYERNGGLILISDVQLYGQVIKALPTRDAFLPIWTYLFYALDNGMKASEPVEGFPYAVSGAIKFPMAQGIALTDNMVSSNKDIFQVWFDAEGDIKVSYKEDQNKKELLTDAKDKREVLSIKAFLGQYFTEAEGYGNIISLNFMDAPRIFFDNGRSVHIRQSRNDDDLKNYNEDPKSVAAVRAVRSDVLNKKIPLIIKAIENKKNLQSDFEKAKPTPQIEESI